MAACPKLSACPFFNDKMASKPATAKLMKQRYCHGDNTKCARYTVVTRSEVAVPADLYPNMMGRALAIVGG